MKFRYRRNSGEPMFQWDRWDRKKTSSLREGEKLRDEGLEKTNNDLNAEWREKARNWVKQRSQRKGRFNADDLIACIGEPPGHPNAIGGIWMWAKKNKLIKIDGITKASRAKSHARTVFLYSGIKF